MKTIKWTGATGNEIELRAKCETVMIDDIVSLDGYEIDKGKKPIMDATLELWVNGKKQDECKQVNFWKIIDTGTAGVKKVWGLKVGMDSKQAELVKQFLNEVIEDGKSVEVEEMEESKEEETKEAKRKEAEDIVEEAQETARNDDGTLMTKEQVKRWQKNYNDIYNEGREGYIPRVVSQEEYDYAVSVIGK